MSPAGHFTSTQRVDSDTVPLSITPAVVCSIPDLDLACHHTHLRNQAKDRNRMLVELTRDGTQSCLYHIIAAFVGQSMTQMRRDLGAWYQQPANQTQHCDMLPTNLQTPAEWARPSRSDTNNCRLADECDVYSMALLFDVHLQILSSTTSVQDINIQATRGLIIRHMNSPRVKHFVEIILLRNAAKVSSTVTHNTAEVPAS